MKKEKAVIQSFDASGNIQIPPEIREKLNICEGDPYGIDCDPVSGCITLFPCIVKYEKSQMAVFQVEDTAFIFIQSCDDGWDYTIYDMASMRMLDGGQLDAPDVPICDVAKEICKIFNFCENTISLLPSSFLDSFIN